jgi:hypothetical protein
MSFYSRHHLAVHKCVQNRSSWVIALLHRRYRRIDRHKQRCYFGTHIQAIIAERMADRHEFARVAVYTW